MKKRYFLGIFCFSLLYSNSLVYADDTLDYFGNKLADVNETCSFDSDCISEWCKPDTNKEDSPRHCAAKLAENSPCNEHRECQYYSCVLPETGGSQKLCIRPKLYLNLGDPCTNHEECASGRCGDIGYGQTCLKKIASNASCEGDLQNMCNIFARCDAQTHLCTKGYAQIGEECQYDEQCSTAI